MENQFYGWLGQGKNKTTSIRGSGTNTASYFKYYLTQLGAKQDTEIRSKNLFVMEDGRKYYILSISKGRPTWASSTFIENSKNGQMHLILTQDTGESSGRVWDFPINVIKLTDEAITLEQNGESYIFNRQGRRGAGDYYALSVSKVNDMCRKCIEFDRNDETKSIEKVLREILKIGED